MRITLTPTPPDADNPTLADQIYDMMADAIIRGELPPGSRLIETDLAAHYQVSRGPLREAMRRLGEQRLIVRPARQSARVTQLSVKVLLEISTVRELLESTACRLAAENMNQQELDELHAILDADAAMISKGEAYYHAENRLDVHFCIVRGSGNSIIKDLLCRQLHPLIRMYRYQHKVIKGRADEALKEHRAIVDAISNRDGDLAQFLMQRHLATSRRMLLEALGDN